MFSSFSLIEAENLGGNGKIGRGKDTYSTVLPLVKLADEHQGLELRFLCTVTCILSWVYHGLALLSQSPPHPLLFLGNLFLGGCLATCIWDSTATELFFILFILHRERRDSERLNIIA